MSEQRHAGLGLLAAFPDEALCRFLEGLDVRSIFALAATSKLLRVFCLEEPLWQAQALNSCKDGALVWISTWQKTALALMQQRDGEIPNWVVHNGLGTAFPVEGFSSLELYKRWYRRNMDVAGFDPPTSSIHRVDAGAISPGSFFESFDRPGKPAIIGGLQMHWGAMQWTLEGLVGEFRERRFSINCPGKTSVKMTLENFMQYMDVQCDENPLYLFDGEFGTSCPTMVTHYQVPAIFPEDFFNKLGECRPPYRWVLIGPPRSGSLWHVDPTATSAWNSLISGKKRWALYPPGTMPPGVEFTSVPHPACQDMDFESPSALFWFLEIYPTLEPSDRPIEFLQQPGETVFIPNGWWHCVLNLESSVAVTQNFVSRANLKEVVGCLALGAFWYHSRLYDDQEVGENGATAVGRPVIGCRWLGHWMSRLWQDETHADVKGIIWESSCEYFDSQTWRSILESACRDLQLQLPQKHEILPLSATSNWVFRVGDSIIKVYLNEVEMKGVVQSTVEELCLRTMADSAAVANGWVPKLKGTHSTEYQLPTTKLNSPVLVTSLCPGKSLSECFQRLSEPDLIVIATEIGKVLAHIHTIPLRRSTHWMAHCKESDTVSFHDCSSMTEWFKSQICDGTFWQAQDPTVAWSSMVGEIRAADVEGGQPSAMVQHQDKARQCHSGWYPFIAFLRWRRGLAMEHHKKCGFMPPKLICELDGYLPDDPSVLVEASSQCDPCWLHGDMTHDNLLTTLGNGHSTSPTSDAAPHENGLCSPAVAVVDFGDAGHGDALYDFVAVAISSLKCRQALLPAFFDSYLRNRGLLLADGEGTSGFSNRKIRLSKIAMCYTLLHEDTAIRRMLELRPELAQAQTLEEIQIACWGFLDECVLNRCH